MATKPTVVIAQDWKAFAWWCAEHQVDHRDTVSLIQPLDAYRVYGRVTQGCRVVRVGKIEEETLAGFRRALLERGVVI